jgi:hypothetical protein
MIQSEGGGWLFLVVRADLIEMLGNILGYDQKTVD